MERRKKLRCPNCGTLIKEDEKSCSICHMVIERPKEEVDGEEEEFTLKEEFPIGRIAMIVFIVIGIILTVKGGVEFQNSDYCNTGDCAIKSLFMAGLGIILIISAAIALALDQRKYKKA